MRICAIPNCNQEAKTYSPYCYLHKRRKAKHGHPFQTAITVRELKPSRSAVKQWLKRRSTQNAVELMNRLLEALVQDARITLEQYNAGKPSFGHYVEASRIILRVVEENTNTHILETLLSVGYYYELYSKRFASEEAFKVQVARRFRALSQRSFGVTWDHKKQTARKVYREVRARVIRALADLLMQSRLPLYGIKIAEKDLEERSFWRPDDRMVTAAVLGSSPLNAAEGGGSV